jgi:hypothetical protein
MTEDKSQQQQQQQHDPRQLLQRSHNIQTSRKHPPRRWILQQMFLASSATALVPLTILPPDANAVAATGAATALPPTPRLPFFNSKYSLSVVTNTNTTAASSIRQPSKESSLFPPELATESCLLKLLPVKTPIFRKLEQQLLSVSSYTPSLSLSSSSLLSLLEDEQSTTSRGRFETIIVKMNETLTLIDNKRSYLEPVFNMDDSTVVSISKATRGESLVESLRNEIASIQSMAEARNVSGILMSQKRALRRLAEVGELLVEKFPYDVPKEGKFSYLPRLLGRTQVTFTM